MTTLQAEKPVDVISKFVSFKLLIASVDYYTKVRPDFRIKSAVSNVPLVVNADERKLFGDSR